MNKTLYSCLIEEQNSKEAFFQSYWSRASHLGEAIRMMLDSAKANGLSNPIPREGDLYDINHLETEVAPNPASEVFWSTTRYFFPPEPEHAFILPVGVIPSFTESEYAHDEITCGYTLDTDEDGLISMKVNVESDELFPLYRQLIELHNKYKVFWYILHSHWDDESEDRFLVNEQLNTPRKIIGHLQQNLSDSIRNGFVTLTAYLEEGATNLNISDHKRIIVTTYSAAAANRYSQMLEDSGYSRNKTLISIDYKIHHWHYCLPESKSKTELEKMLKKSGFNDWKPNEGK